MFFILSKILSFISSPVFWIALLLLLAVFGKRKWRKKFLIASLSCFFFFSNGFILSVVLESWETPKTAYDELDKYQVGIVLGGIAERNNTIDRLQFGRSADRLWQSLELYKRGYIEKILFVGGSGSVLHPETKEAHLIERYLNEIGIPQEDILYEDQSRNTHENAINSKKVLSEANLNTTNLLLITSAFHMKRSIACFKKAGLSVTPYSTDKYSKGIASNLSNLLVPSEDALKGWQVLLHEWFGLIVYKIKGYA